MGEAFQRRLFYYNVTLYLVQIIINLLKNLPKLKCASKRWLSWDNFLRKPLWHFTLGNGEKPWLWVIFLHCVPTLFAAILKERLWKNRHYYLMVTMSQLVSRIIIVEDARCYVNSELSNSFFVFNLFRNSIMSRSRTVNTNARFIPLVNFFRSRSQKQEISLVCILLQAV